MVHECRRNNRERRNILSAFGFSRGFTVISKHSFCKIPTPLAVLDFFLYFLFFVFRLSRCCQPETREEDGHSLLSIGSEDGKDPARRREKIALVRNSVTVPQTQDNTCFPPRNKSCSLSQCHLAYLAVFGEALANF